MRALIGIVLVSVILSSVNAVNEVGLQFREFLQGFTKGLGYPVPFEYIRDKNIDETDINVPSLFTSLQQLATLNDTNYYKVAGDLYDIRGRLIEFWNKRKQIVDGSSNLTEALIITYRTFQDGAAFLFEVKRKNYIDDLKSVGQAIPKHASFAGQQLGFILRNTYGGFVSRFLHGLANGIGAPVPHLYLVDNNFDNSTINVRELLTVLSVFKSSPINLKRTVQLFLTELDYEFASLGRTRSTNINAQQNLALIFNKILPVIFEDIQVTIGVIESNDLFKIYPIISVDVDTNIEITGARIGQALRATYEKLIRRT